MTNEKTVYVVGVNGDNKVSVLEEDSAIQAESEGNFTPKLTQAFEVPQAENVSEFESIFGGTERFLDFVNSKISAHCTTRIYNIMKNQDKEGNFTHTPSDSPISLAQYLSEPLRETLSQEKRVRRLLEKHFGSDKDKLAAVLASLQ